MSNTIEVRFSRTGEGEAKTVTCLFGVPVDSLVDNLGDVPGGLAAVRIAGSL